MDEMNHPAFAPAILNSGASNKPHYRLPDNILGNQTRFPILGGSLYNSVATAYIAAPLYRVWGFTLITQRLFEALLSFIVLLLFYQLAQRWLKQTWVAWAITCCLAVDPLLTFQVRTVGYGFTLMLIPILIMLLILRSCWERDVLSSGAAIGLGGCTAAALSTYWVGAPLMAIPYLAAMHLARRKGRLILLLIATIIFLSPYLYALISVYLQTPQVFKNFGMPGFAVVAQQKAAVPIFGKMSGAAMEYFKYFTGGPALNFTGVGPLSLGVVKSYLLISAMLLAFAFVIHSLRRRAQRREASFTLMAVIGPLLGFSCIVVGLASVGFHHMLSTLPFAYLALGYLCVRVSELASKARPWLFYSIPMAVPLFLFFSAIVQQREVVQALRQNGGVGLYNERLGQVSILKPQLYPDSFLVFTDWGFHLQFLYLTEGTVPYFVAFEDPKTWFPKVLMAKKDIVLCTFPERTNAMVAAAHGAGAATEVRPVVGRDGTLIFNFVRAMVDGSPSASGASAQAEKSVMAKLR